MESLHEVKYNFNLSRESISGIMTITNSFCHNIAFRDVLGNFNCRGKMKSKNNILRCGLIRFSFGIQKYFQSQIFQIHIRLCEWTCFSFFMSQKSIGNKPFEFVQYKANRSHFPCVWTVIDLRKRQSAEIFVPVVPFFRYTHRRTYTNVQ